MDKDPQVKSFGNVQIAPYTALKSWTIEPKAMAAHKCLRHLLGDHVGREDTKVGVPDGDVAPLVRVCGQNAH